MKTVNIKNGDIESKIITVQADVDFTIVHCPLEWQKRGLQQTRTGYGGKLTTQNKALFNGKLYRIYATCWSNVATCWFTVKGQQHIIN